jgi:hypothetical protein
MIFRFPAMLAGMSSFQRFFERSKTGTGNVLVFTPWGMTHILSNLSNCQFIRVCPNLTDAV